ncbi:hypothetical protein BAUCODRAFT_172256 [Baudoinia panamericana UAMH 10762]|uniref:Transcription factor domain-containing protein n=1 Tax=Baudoinia panamericana (strain UAMH 10762) TaxID=717646 RepID=M2NMU0_BAUPA|nr:uncharacterized protein BAUCODRAFT_172256 [Baudoinia panamericana UAMH 10762]EMD00506.1 hypothetical protein BAUCODRAFT_172256 [Baudoinia panamericana UAMH 10762]
MASGSEDKSVAISPTRSHISLAQARERFAYHKRICAYDFAACTGCLPTRRDHRLPETESSLETLPDPASSDAETPKDISSVSEPKSPPWLTAIDKTSSPASLQSAQSIRFQLLEEFCHSYFPLRDQDTDHMYTKLLSRDSLQPITVGMQVAVDALCLLQMGTNYRDSYLLHQAVAQYDKALVNLQYDLSRVSDVTSNEGILGTIYVLGFCEMFRAVSSNGHGERTHHLGLQGMLIARGPDKQYSAFAQLLLYNLRHLTAIYGAIDCKRVPLRDAAWKRCAAMTSRLTTELSDLVLEVTDRLAAHKPRDRHTLTNALLPWSMLESRLQSWLVRWMRSFEHLPYRTVKATAFTHFTLHTIGCPNVFPRAYEFPSFAISSAQTTYWIMSLQVKQKILEIDSICDDRPLRSRLQALTDEATECATHLCQSVAWMTLPQHGSCGIMRASGPLHYAVRWFDKLKDWRRVAWCGKVKSSIESCGMVSPYSGNFVSDNELSVQGVDDGPGPRWEG